MGAGETLAALETTSKYSLAKGKIDDFFIQWLSLPHTQEEIAALINDAKHDRPLQVASPNPFPRIIRGRATIEAKCTCSHARPEPCRPPVRRHRLELR